MDLGTGDGRLPYVLAEKAPDRLFIGIDANAAALRDRSGRAARAGRRNLVYVRSAVESLPSELTGLADHLTVILPWGSLLATVALPVAPLLQNIARLCQPNAALTVVLGVDPARDRAEVVRLGLPALDAAHLEGALIRGYAEAGFTVGSVRTLSAGEFSQWPSTWARTLAQGHPRSIFRIDARR